MKFLVVASLAGVFALPGACAAEVAPSPASCALVADYLTGMKPTDGNKFVYGEDAESSFVPVTVDGWFATGKPESRTPPKALIDKFNGTKLVSAIKYCPNARAVLDKLGVGYGAAAAEKASAKPDYDVEGVAAPVLTNDGDGALLVLSSRRANLLADRVIQYMRRDKSGHWVVAALHRF